MSTRTGEGPPLQNETTNEGSEVNHEVGIDRMVSKGWCIHQATHMAKTCPPELFTHLTTLQRTHNNSRDHRQCAAKDWRVADDVDFDNYTTQHVEQSCTCSMIAAPYDQMTKIIDQGKVPLISIHEAKDVESPLRFKVHERRPWSTYTALSHVWADDLGNLNENAIPECQARRILRALKRFDHRYRPLFWFDTLCIPIKKEDAGLKRRTIHRMGGIYYYASTVLVLDAELMHLKVPPDNDHASLLARLLCSVWMARSWTLQEGLLSLRCNFVIRDEVFNVVSHRNYSRSNRSPVSVRRLRERTWGALSVLKAMNCRWTEYLPGDPISDSEIQAAQQLMEFFEAQPWGKYTGTSLERPDRFVFVWNALASRSTTKPEDLVVVIANLLGLSWKEVQSSGDSTERLGRIILSLDVVPQALLFNTGTSVGSRPNQNFRWLPSEPTRKRLNKPLMRRTECTFSGIKWSVYRLAIDRINVLQPGLSIFFTRERISSRRRNYTTVLGGNRYSLEVPLSEQDELDLESYAMTAIAIEDGALLLEASENEHPVPITIFYTEGTYWFTEPWACASLSYLCSSTLTRIHRTESAEHDESPDLGKWRHSAEAIVYLKLQPVSHIDDIAMSVDCPDADNPNPQKFQRHFWTVSRCSIFLTGVMTLLAFGKLFRLEKPSSDTPDSSKAAMVRAFGYLFLVAGGTLVLLLLILNNNPIEKSFPGLQRRVHAILWMHRAERTAQ